MSKRKRQSDGPTLAMARPCISPASAPYYSEVDRGSILGKRPSIDDVFSSDKRFRGEFLDELHHFENWVISTQKLKIPARMPSSRPQ